MSMYIRKEMFSKGAESPITFPNKTTQATGVVSPRVGRHHGVPDPLRPNEAGFAEQMDEVMQVRATVIRGEWPTEFLQKHAQLFGLQDFEGSYVPQPIQDAGVSFDDPEAAALLVRMDWPTDLAVYIFLWLRREGVSFREHEGSDFVNNTVGFTAQLSAYLWKVIELTFQVKYYFGCVRPEEYFGIDGCVFTAYTEGCPAHPAYPAGHGAMAGAILRFLEWMFDLSSHPEVWNEVKATVYHFAQYRTFAGVHTAADNIEGLKFGYRIDLDPVTINP